MLKSHARTGLTALVLGFTALPGGLTSAADPPKTSRVIAGTSSANEVMGSLEHVVVKLAEKKKSWDEKVKDNLEIFLIGVSRDQPVRFDPLLSAEFGMQTQTIVPVTDLKMFLEDNLDPIGIVNKRDRSDGELYELQGGVYQGWLRSLAIKDTPPYTVIYPQKEAIPKGMSHPQELHKDLVKGGPLGFVRLVNTAEEATTRKTAFAKYREKALEAFGPKLSTETQEQYALRKRLREQSLSVIEQWFVESAEVQLIAKVDREKNEFPASLTFSALPGTTLHKDVEQIAAQKSLFGGIQAPADAVLSGRIFLPMDPDREPGFREIYELMRPVLKKKIDESTKATAPEKAARQLAATAFIDVLRDSSVTPMFDGFIDVYPNKGKHTLVMALESANTEKINAIVDQLEEVVAAWKLEKNVDKSGEVAIHKLTLGEKVPPPMVEFYGDSRCVYLAVAPNAFWISAGEGSLEALKQRMEIAAKPDRPASDGTMFSLSMHARPVLKNIHESLTQSDLDLFKSFNPLSRAQAKEAAKPKAEEPAKPGVRPGGGGQGGARLANFEWENTAIAAMDGLDDRMELSIKRTEAGKLVGTGNSQKGILKALGAVIAKFADENL